MATLHEHKYPVNSLSVSYDQQFLLSSSQDEGEVKIWSVSDIYRDITSHSRFSFETGKRVNQITSISNSEMFALACSDGTVEVHDMARLPNSHSSLSAPRNSGYPNPRQATHTNLRESLKHEMEGDIISCLDTYLPISHQSMLTYCSQRGSFFMHDLRCRMPAVEHRDQFGQQRGMITCLTQGQDPYQLFCGTIGGYVMVYDIRYNLLSTTFKHNQKYPINSVQCFKPPDLKNYNSSSARSPLVLVSAGGPTYEMSLLNLDTGKIEMLFSVDDSLGQGSKVDDQIGTHQVTNLPSFYRESLIRDNFGWPEKQETYQSQFKRYVMQTRSLVSTQQIKLTQNLDDELFKASKDRYRLLKQQSESKNGCKKILVPRRYTSILQGT